MSLSRIVYLVLIFIASWSAYYLYSKYEAATEQVAPNMEMPQFSGQNLENTSYNKHGLRSHKIYSSHLDYYADSGETIFTNPILSVYRDGKEVEWRVTAHRAVLSKKQVLTLYDTVNVKNLLPDASFSTMTTDKLIINLASRFFRADNKVTIIAPHFETIGAELNGNFKFNKATLYNSVQGKYETLTP